MNRNLAGLILGVFSGNAVYDIVALQYASNGYAEYTAVCADGYRFQVVYDSGWESYRLSLGEVYATFDLAALRACGRKQRTAREDSMGTGWQSYLPSNLLETAR